MAIIKLEELEFFGYHGFFGEEQKLGNRFSVDIAVEYPDHAGLIGYHNEAIALTIDYMELYRIIAEQMAIKTPLLEQLAGHIINRVYDAFPGILSCEVAVAKLNPPIGGICKAARIVVKR